MIELSIGGKPYHFLLDTGATGGRISPSVVATLGLKPVGEVRAGDPSGKNSKTVQIYKIPEITAGTAHFYGVQMFSDGGVNDKSLADGVIGYAVFQDLLLTLDYPKRQVILERGKLPASAMNYTTEHGIPVLPIEVGSLKIDGHVDSGSDGGLYIPTKYKSKLNIDGEPKVLGHARTLFNEFDILGVKVKDPIKVGGMTINVPLIEMHDLFPIGNIGGRVLSQYRVTIDQKNRRIQFDSPK
jgi:hypothetical protein